MPTKAQVEDALGDAERRLELLEEDVFGLLDVIRDHHDASHDEPWAVCRSAVCREAIYVESMHEHRRLWGAA